MVDGLSHYIPITVHNGPLWPIGFGSTIIYHMIDRFHLLLHFIRCLALREFAKLVLCLEARGASWEMDKRTLLGLSKLSPMSQDLRVWPEMRDTRDTPKLFMLHVMIFMIFNVQNCDRPLGLGFQFHHRFTELPERSHCRYPSLCLFGDVSMLTLHRFWHCMLCKGPSWHLTVFLNRQFCLLGKLLQFWRLHTQFL